MRTTTTLILLAITAGLLTWVLLHERRGPPPNLDGHLLFDYSERVVQTGAPAVDIDVAAVTGIDLKSAAGPLAFKRRDDGSWDIIRTIKDRADRTLVQQLLDFCAKARIEGVLDRDEIAAGKVSAASLGLDDANAWRVVWKKEGAKLAEIRVGKTAPLGNAVYVRVEDQRKRPDIYVVTPDLRALLARPVDSFRDPRVMKYPLADIQRMVVRRGEGEVEFSRAARPDGGAPWVISRPLPNAPADQAGVQDFVAMICGAKIEGWTAPPANPAEPGPVDKPAAQVTLYAGDAPGRRPVTLAFYPDPAGNDKTALVHDRERKTVFKVAKQLLDDLTHAGDPNDFRSRRLGDIDPEKVHSVQIASSAGESVHAVRTGRKWSWRPLGGERFEEATPARVTSLVGAINEATITEFASDSLADPARFGLDKPAYVVSFGGTPHVSLDQLSPMTERDTRTLRIGITPEGKIFASFQGEPFVYRIGPEVPSAIPDRFISWRSLLLPGYSIRQVRALTRTAGSEPPLELKFEPRSFQWTATRAGADVTALLDAAAAEALAGRMGALQAVTWIESPDAALRALEQPDVIIEVRYDAWDERDPNVTRSAVMRLELAPMSGEKAPFCFGRINTMAEPFLIEAATLRMAMAPLIKRPAPP